MSIKGCTRVIKGDKIYDFDVWLPSKQKNLQRGYVWTSEQKQALILTILRDQKIQPIVAIKHCTDKAVETPRYEIIDGKQRLTTIVAFLKDEFRVNIEGFGEYYFSNLPKACKSQITSFWIPWDVHYSYSDDEISDDTKIQIFEECNFLGTPQDTNHLKYLKQP